jgi:hypothetical protein
VHTTRSGEHSIEQCISVTTGDRVRLLGTAALSVDVARFVSAVKAAAAGTDQEPRTTFSCVTPLLLLLPGVAQGAWDNELELLSAVRELVTYLPLNNRCAF